MARRDDGIPAEVNLIHARKLDREGLIRPYNLLGNENLYRAVLYDTQDEGKYLYLDFHHILVDEASFLVMFDDLKALMLKVYHDEDGTLYLKFDTSLDFSTQEIDRMAARMDELLTKYT